MLFTSNETYPFEQFQFFRLFRYTCRGLFEAHKLLFSFQMCVKILEAAQKINMDEYQFFLRGGIVSRPEAFICYSSIPCSF